MYQLKVRIAGEAWQVCLVVTATLMCVFALFGQPFSPVGMIGAAFTAVTVISPMIMQGSWNRRYYSALSTFPVAALAVLCANTVFQPLAESNDWPAIIAAITTALLIIVGHHLICSAILDRIDQREYDKYHH